MLSVEELLKPRYKVIADYPFCPYSVGQLMKQNCSGSFYITKSAEYVDGVRIDIEDSVFELEINKYPHLFKKLEWWEERTDDEMPKYVRYIVGDNIGKVVRIVDRILDGIIFHIEDEIENRDYNAYASHFVPATETEYNEYLKTK